MSNESWRSEVRAALERQPQPPKIAVMGIGHELRGDDAAGLAVVHTLEGRKNLLVIEAGTEPENHTSKLRRFLPDLVLLIDTAQMDRAPGGIGVLDLGALDGLGANTHTMPISLVAQYIASEIGCEVLLIGLQPGNTDLGAALSPSVRRAVEDIRRGLRRLTFDDTL